MDVEKGGLKQIKTLAVEDQIFNKPIDIEAFADERFNERRTGEDFKIQ